MDQVREPDRQARAPCASLPGLPYHCVRRDPVGLPGLWCPASAACRSGPSCSPLPALPYRCSGCGQGSGQRLTYGPTGPQI